MGYETVRMHSVWLLLPRAKKSNLLLLPAAGVLAVGTTGLVVHVVTPAALVLGLVALVSWGQWSLLRRATRQLVPLAAIVVTGLNVVGVLGWLYYPSIADRAAVSADLPQTRLIYSTAASIFALASASIFLGGLVGRGRRPPGPAALQEQITYARAAIQLVSPKKLSLAACLPLLVEIIAYTPSALWSRATYSASAGPVIVHSIAGILTPAGVVVTAMLSFRENSRVRKMGLWFLLCYTVMFFSMGSRQLAMVPIILLLMYLERPASNAGRKRMTKALLLLTAATASLLLLQLPLALRGGNHAAGLDPYTHLVMADPRLVFGVHRLAGPVGNVLFSVPLSGTVATMPRFPSHFLTTSLSPLPGFMTDWPQISGNMRVNAFTPTDALGELRNYGPGHLIIFGFLLGLIITRLQYWNSKLTPGRAALGSIAGIGCTAGLSLGLLQYNLRSDLREFWYYILLSTILHLRQKADVSKS